MTPARTARDAAVEPMTTAMTSFRGLLEVSTGHRPLASSSAQSNPNTLCDDS